MNRQMWARRPGPAQRCPFRCSGDDQWIPCRCMGEDKRRRDAVIRSIGLCRSLKLMIRQIAPLLPRSVNRGATTTTSGAPQAWAFPQRNLDAASIGDSGKAPLFGAAIDKTRPIDWVSELNELLSRWGAILCGKSWHMRVPSLSRPCHAADLFLETQATAIPDSRAQRAE